MLKTGNELDRSGASRQNGNVSVTAAGSSTGAAFSHGPYGPNGLYRAHNDRSTGPGFASAHTRGISAGRGFGAPPPASNPLPTVSSQIASTVSASSRNAGFGAQAASGAKGSFVSPVPPVGGADLSRWGGTRGGQAPATTSEISVRTPELQLLVVDDDEEARAVCSQTASGMGFNVLTALNVAAARAILRHQMIDLLLLDLKLPGGADVMALVEEIRINHTQTAVVVMTANASVDSAVEAIRMGAGDYLTKPLILADLTSVLERVGQSRQFDIESRLLRERLRTPNGMGKIIGRSPEMEKLYRILSKVAPSSHPVLILGESGTGKELVARSIHDSGPKASKPFIAVECSSITPTLMESELFGYVKGAFTGANKTKEGLLAAADGGTVFLDEIGEIPLDMQAKLLRALQEKEVRPVGATHAVPISARVLAATNRDLAAMVEQGRFRKDLYFRLNVVNLRIPPLRDRPEDIPILAMHFLEKMKKRDGRDYEFSNDSLRTMMEFPWPGNVRELENAIERACAFSSGPILHMDDMPSQLQDFRQQNQRRRAEAASEASRSVAPVAAQHNPATEQIVSIAEMEKNAILGTIRHLQGDKLLAARLLGIGKTTLYRKLKEYGLEVDAELDN